VSAMVTTVCSLTTQTPSVRGTARARVEREPVGMRVMTTASSSPWAGRVPFSWRDLCTSRSARTVRCSPEREQGSGTSPYKSRFHGCPPYYPLTDDVGPSWRGLGLKLYAGSVLGRLAVSDRVFPRREHRRPRAPSRGRGADPRGRRPSLAGAASHPSGPRSETRSPPDSAVGWHAARPPRPRAAG